MSAKSGDKGLEKRIKTGGLTRMDIARRLAELAFGKANDCVKLVLETESFLQAMQGSGDPV